MDSMLDIRNIPVLESTLTDSNVRKSIRLLCVFGSNGQEVIYMTDEDKAYVFGCNRYGALGLGLKQENIRSPLFNPHLSDKQFIDIFCGSEHWIALTSNGRCYSWGVNQFGQLGIGSTETTKAPLFIRHLSHQRIVGLSLGDTHSLALTSKGQVYAWGNNMSGLLGRHSDGLVLKPIRVYGLENITSISCGKKHSIALTAKGRVYGWGLNNFGQLGLEKKKYISHQPKSPSGLVPIVFVKAICGPNHSLLLSSDGYVYAFGSNSCGQVGSSSADKQFIPLKASEYIRFKDIIANNDNDISIGVSTDNKFFVWGFAKNRRILIPKEMPDLFGYSLFDIFAKNAKTKVTYKTIVINDGLKTSEQMEGSLTTTDDNNELKELIEMNKSEDICHKFSNLFGDESQNFKSLDSVLELKYFPFLNRQLGKQPRFRENIKLLFIFSSDPNNALFFTYLDKCYAHGNNHYGCLAMGNIKEYTTTVAVNIDLSNKNLIDICNGLQHCIALTASGLCYSWGCNYKGQLGIGTTKSSTSPQFIKELSNKKVIQISCGAYYSMALTVEGQVYSWGNNLSGQLGLGHCIDCTAKPTLVQTKHSISLISSGRNHSLAITGAGMVYMWGYYNCEQLDLSGKPTLMAAIEANPQWIVNTPTPIPQISNIQFKKAICGPNYSLLLTNDGFIYAFGDNSCGQIGNGGFVHQKTPIKITDKIRFKDIISHFENNLSIGISTDDQYWVWGLANNQKVSAPKLIPNSTKASAFNIYLKFALKKIIFTTIVSIDTNGMKSIDNWLSECKIEETNDCYEDSIVYYSDDFEEDLNDFKSTTIEEREDNQLNHFQDINNLVDNSNTASKVPSICDNLSVISSVRTSVPLNTLQSYMIKSFNNKDNSDLTIISGDKTIYCHKTILQIRNNKFWEVLSNQLSDNKIEICAEYYESFYAFLQYLYGMEPEFNDKMVYFLQSMAEIFDEKDLLDDCSHYIDSIKITPNLSNVCALYEKAINESLTDLEKSCIEFAIKNWKNVLRSDEFLLMNDSLSKQLVISVYNLQ